MHSEGFKNYFTQDEFFDEEEFEIRKATEELGGFSLLVYKRRFMVGEKTKEEKKKNSVEIEATLAFLLSIWIKCKILESKDNPFWEKCKGLGCKIAT